MSATNFISATSSVSGRVYLDMAVLPSRTSRGATAFRCLTFLGTYNLNDSNTLDEISSPWMWQESCPPHTFFKVTGLFSSQVEMAPFHSERVERTTRNLVRESKEGFGADCRRHIAKFQRYVADPFRVFVVALVDFMFDVLSSASSSSSTPNSGRCYWIGLRNIFNGSTSLR